FVDLSGLPGTVQQVALVDATGRQVWGQAAPANLPILTVDAQMLPSGVYLLRVTTPSQVYWRRIVRQ
ncbi:MAG: T9SS type A sorting domain-containing protein, partial [Hymenobacter sp.]